ncbi:MAG: helix-turn-helix domain-containing protein [Paracoccaceae bacterium]|nr:helix-turn-helix domain-containing protein [Paracoccaceae bacterium]MDE3239002.1 helix-turn-helix domain-containing protein [Paracoccaceae bacterium]
MSENILRLIRVLEAFADSPAGGVSAADLIARSGLASSTAYRMIGELEEAGYVYRAGDRLLRPNFAFERRIAAGVISPGQLWDVCAEISGSLEAAAEVILLRGQNLLWHLTAEHPQQPIRLRAHPGFVRSTYELDSISRLALAHQPIDKVAASWDKSAFFDAGVAKRQIGWVEVAEKLARVDVCAMQYDMAGNAKGVRRFCVAVSDDAGGLVCLLTVAEAAVPLRDEAAHIARIEEVLMGARERLAVALPTERAREARSAG